MNISSQQRYPGQQRVLYPGMLLTYEFNKSEIVFLVLSIDRKRNMFNAFVFKQTYNDIRNGVIKQYVLSTWEQAGTSYINEI